MLDIWGQVRREIEAAARRRARRSAANLANATLAEQSALALAYVQLRQADSLDDLLTNTVSNTSALSTITQNQYNAGNGRQVGRHHRAGVGLNGQAQQISAGVARAQSEHAIAVLMGRPPAELVDPARPSRARHPRRAGALAFDLARAPTRHRRGGTDDAGANAAIGVAFAGYFPTSRSPAPSATSAIPS